MRKKRRKTGRKKEVVDEDRSLVLCCSTERSAKMATCVGANQHGSPQSYPTLGDLECVVLLGITF